MSEESDMWDRFFAGSKYEWKWRLTNRPLKPLTDEQRAAIMRILEGDVEPRAAAANPFERPAT